jgi:hypothetical protein
LPARFKPDFDYKGLNPSHLRGSQYLYVTVLGASVSWFTDPVPADKPPVGNG